MYRVIPYLLGAAAQLLVPDEVLQLLVALVLVRHGLDIGVLRHRAAVHPAEVTVENINIQKIYNVILLSVFSFDFSGTHDNFTPKHGSWELTVRRPSSRSGGFSSQLAALPFR